MIINVQSVIAIGLIAISSKKEENWRLVLIVVRLMQSLERRIFVYMENKNTVAKYALILLKWLLEIGYTIVDETIRSMTDMIQIISLIKISWED